MTLRAVLASTGQYLDVLAQPTDTVLQLKQALSVEFDIATHHQVLLTEEGFRLDTKQPLSAYPSLFGHPPPSPSLAAATAAAASPSTSVESKAKADGGGPAPLSVPPREPPCVFVFDRQHMTAHLSASSSASASSSSPSASASASSSTVVVPPGGGSGIAAAPAPEIPPMKAIDLEALATKLPPMRPAPSSHPLLFSDSLLVRGLPEFERTLAHHADIGKAHVEAAAERYRIAAAVEAEIRNQLRAMEAAARNLQGNIKHAARSLADFSERFQGHEAQQRRLIAGFEGALEKLRATELHPTLRKSGRTTLLDCIQEARMRSYAAECQKQLDGLVARARALQGDFAALEASAQQVTSPLLPVPNPASSSSSSSAASPSALPHPAEDLPTLQAQLSALGQALTSEAQPLLQALVDDHAAVAEYLHALSSSSSSSSSSASSSSTGLSPAPYATVNEAAAAFDAQHQRHKTQVLPRLVELDAASARLLAELTQCQQRTYTAGHARLALQAKTLSGLTALGSRLYAYSSALAADAGQGSQPWNQLSMLEAMPDAYHACVSEVSRRRAFRRHFHERANAAAASLQRLREEESAERHRFHAALGRQPLLEEIFTGITEGPPFLQLNLRDSDAVLPEIDLPDHHAAFPSSASSSSSPSSSASLSSPAPALPASEHHQQQHAAAVARLEAENAELRAQLQRMKEREREESQQKQRQGEAPVESKQQQQQQQQQQQAAEEELRKRRLSFESREASLLQHLRQIDAKLGPNAAVVGESKDFTPGSPLLAALTGAGEASSPARRSQEADKLLRRVAQRASELVASLEQSRLNGADLEIKLKEAKEENKKQANRIRALEAKLQTHEAKHTIHLKNTVLLKKELDQVRSDMQYYQHEMYNRAALVGLAVNDIGIFARTPSGHYEAILLDQPHRYLTEDCLRELRKQGLVTGEGPAHLALRAIMVDRKEAKAEQNPFKLPIGTVYYEVDGEPLSRSAGLAPSSPSSSLGSLGSLGSPSPSSSSLSEQIQRIEGKRPGAKAGQGAGKA